MAMRVAIIGVGVLDTSTAFHLALAGVEVVVADQAHTGQATASGAGIVWPSSSGRVDSDWCRIADAGARCYPTLIQYLAGAGEAETGHRRVGALSVAAGEGELDRIEQAVRARAALVPEAGKVTRLSPARAMPSLQRCARTSPRCRSAALPASMDGCLPPCCAGRQSATAHASTLV